MKKETSISELLQSEHRWVAERLEHFGQGLDKGQVSADPFHEAGAVLHRHIYLEEDILFPQVEVRGLMGPAEVLAQEHGEICGYLNGIGDLVKAGAPAGRVQAAFTALRSLLDEHNLKEEQVLYPAADRLLEPDELAQMLQKLTAAQRPENWVCRAHRKDSQTSGI